MVVLRLVGLRHVEQLHFGPDDRDAGAADGHDLGDGSGDARVPAERPCRSLDRLGEEVERLLAAVRLQLERGRCQRVTVPRPPATAGRIDAAEVPLRPECGVHRRLIGPGDDHLDVVVVTGLLPQPQVDRPAPGHRPPHTDAIHHLGHGGRRERHHHAILQRSGAPRFRAAPTTSPRT